MAEFLKQRGNYRSLIVYQKAECIYDITHYFAHTYLNKGDRTPQPSQSPQKPQKPQ